MSQPVEYNKDEIIEVLRHINGIVVSLDRLGAAHTDMTNDLWRKAVVDYFLNSESLRSLAKCRKVLSAPFPSELGEDNMDELERELEDSEYWSYRAFLEKNSNA
jgi:hypothetical protein